MLVTVLPGKLSGKLTHVQLFAVKAAINFIIAIDVYISQGKNVDC